MQKSSYQKLRTKIDEIQKQLTIYFWHKEVFETSDQLDEDEVKFNIAYRGNEALEKIREILNETEKEEG